MERRNITNHILALNIYLKQFIFILWTHSHTYLVLITNLEESQTDYKIWFVTNTAAMTPAKVCSFHLDDSYTKHYIEIQQKADSSYYLESIVGILN